jgi:transcriptional regulator with XRE-family HTH domain
MAKRLEDIIASLPPQRQQAIQEETERLIAEEMTLQELRKALAQSQQEISKALHVNQAQVSKIERRTDMYVSTLRSFIEAMGGQLEIIARLPHHAPVRITQFEGLSKENATTRKPPIRRTTKLQEKDASKAKSLTEEVNGRS